MTQNVRLQNLRDFTVQIRNDADQIVGTGIAVSMDGMIITCAHVVKAAGVDPYCENGDEVHIHFPQVRPEDKNCRAIVYKYFPNNDDDVVLLKLKDGHSPLAPGQVAILGTAESSDDHPFRSYGYRRLENYVAGRAHGTILGNVESPEDKNLLGEPVELDSNQINYGMSGSAVLDTERNLIVGIVSETWFPDQSGKNANTAWAVDCKTLGFEPLLLPLHDKPLPLQFAPSPKLDAEEAVKIEKTAVIAVKQRVEKYEWNNAPEVVKTWVGRERLLEHLTNDWLDPKQHVIGLIGFGGEGKSSLVRKWLDNVLNDSNLQKPDGIFWWTFTEKQSADEFLDAALAYVSNNLLDASIITSSHQRAQIIGKMLGAGRYIFVLDGLEWMQYSDGDDYGVLRNENLRDLLTYFANPDNHSFCLVTSRLPLIDLMPYTTYLHRDVDRLSDADGNALLQNLGVKGSDESLIKLVNDWDGHALTLSLLGAYIQEESSGEINDSLEINTPIEGKPRFENVRRILETYNGILNTAERAFLMLLSLFYEPMNEKILEDYIRDKNYSGSLCSPIAKLNPDEYQQMLEKLQRAHLLRYSPSTKCYSPHALVKIFYAHLIREERSEGYQDAVEDIANYYASLARENIKPIEKIADLKPQFDAVRYYCRCKQFDDAFGLAHERFLGYPKAILTHQLGAYDTTLSILLEFFPKGDTSQQPLVSKPQGKRWILNEIGLCLMNLGRLREAVPFYERAAKSHLEEQDWSNASTTYRNLAHSHTQLGALDASAEAARQVLNLARKADDKRDERNSFCLIGTTDFLLGDLQRAGSSFIQAEKLEREIDSNTRYLYSLRGIQHADHLRRIGDLDYAHRVTEANLQICERNHWTDYVSQIHHILGDLDFDTNNPESARAHYESALKIARGISDRAVLIEALLARGRFYAKVNQTSEFLKNSEVSTAQAFTDLNDPSTGSGRAPLSDAFNDLNEALTYALEGGYRIYEADIRVALAWAHLASVQSSVNSGQPALSKVEGSIVNGLQLAKAEAERALQMSQEMGYHWGKVDAEEALKEIGNR